MIVTAAGMMLERSACVGACSESAMLTPGRSLGSESIRGITPTVDMVMWEGANRKSAGSTSVPAVQFSSGAAQGQGGVCVHSATTGQVRAAGGRGGREGGGFSVVSIRMLNPLICHPEWHW